MSESSEQVTNDGSFISSSSSSVAVSTKKRQRIACDHCRQRKSKCDGTLPCSYCKEKGISCRYAEPTRRGPVSKKECNNGMPSLYVKIEYDMNVIDVHGSVERRKINSIVCFINMYVSYARSNLLYL